MEWITLSLHLVVLLGIGALILLGRSAKAYSEEKGKNQATKEDMGHITDQIESVRAHYADMLAADMRHHQLSMAALEKRLETHQKAFSWWRRMLVQANATDNFEFFKDCETWWEENCLYLSPDASRAFRKAMDAAFFHQKLKAAGGIDYQDNWEKLRSAGEVIIRAVQLPDFDVESLSSRLLQREGDG